MVLFLAIIFRLFICEVNILSKCPLNKFFHCFQPGSGELPPAENYEEHIGPSAENKQF